MLHVGWSSRCCRFAASAWFVFIKLLCGAEPFIPAALADVLSLMSVRCSCWCFIPAEFAGHFRGVLGVHLAFQPLALFLGFFGCDALPLVASGKPELLLSFFSCRFHRLLASLACG